MTPPPTPHLVDTLYHVALERTPYPYQRTLAQGAWPHLLHIPTGLGKTAAILLAWLMRYASGHAHRRLVWCLPMRVLVEQTADLAALWIGKLHTAGLIPAISVYRFLGGQVDKDWCAEPEAPAVLVGTQDQLLSRALNRGYAMSRYRWPMDFALLHNDCLWVFDEVQLMGAALPTSAQLEAFRQRFGVFFPCHSLWCSATLQADWLKTVDFAPSVPSLHIHSLGDEDKAMPEVRQRLCATKTLQTLPPQSSEQLAQHIIDAHQPSTRTLAVCNTVRESRELCIALQKRKPAAQLLLIHSRFRPPDRQTRLHALLQTPPPEGTIAVTTQVVEAGVDVSAATLFTTLAPWAAMVQRFGRCNRAGEYEQARIFWVDVDTKDNKKCAPYTRESLENSRTTLKTLRDAGPNSLPSTHDAAPPTQILRATDMVELFDTTPYIAGADTDISRYIREGDERDVQVFWRHIAAPKDGPALDAPAPVRDELCSVPIYDLRTFLRKATAWRWDHLDGRWLRHQHFEPLYPGMTLCLNAANGGYDPELGFVGSGSKKAVTPLVPEGVAPLPDSNDTDAVGTWLSLAEHGAQCRAAMQSLLDALGAPVHLYATELLDAALYHDWGKGHAIYQTALGATEAHDTTNVWAKGPRLARYGRRGFRHELASALALLHTGHNDLVAYLAAAHHGKVRLSIRSLPQEKVPAPEGRRFARGIWEGDTLPAVPMPGDKKDLPALEISLACMEMGRSEYGASWLERMLTLRDTPALGIFRLAYLEALVRVADWRASALHGKGESHA